MQMADFMERVVKALSRHAEGGAGSDTVQREFALRNH